MEEGEIDSKMRDTVLVVIQVQRELVKWEHMGRIKLNEFDCGVDVSLVRVQEVQQQNRDYLRTRMTQQTEADDTRRAQERQHVETSSNNTATMMSRRHRVASCCRLWRYSGSRDSSRWSSKTPTVASSAPTLSTTRPTALAIPQAPAQPPRPTYE